MDLLKTLLEAIATQRPDIVLRSFHLWAVTLKKRYPNGVKITGDVYKAKALLGGELIGKWRDNRGIIFANGTRPDVPDQDDEEGVSNTYQASGKEWAWEGVKVPVVPLPATHLRNYLK